jgi:hypothetical protein
MWHLANDLTNQNFGKIKVINETGERTKDGKIIWNCLCSCGTNCKIVGSDLKKGTKSCGCLSKKYFINLEGQTFNNIQINKFIGKNKFKCFQYEVSCTVCNKNFIAEGNDIKSGKIKSCGCLRSKHMIDKARPKVDSLLSSVYNDYKNKARTREIEFDLTREDFLKFALNNCFYCNSEPMNTKKLRVWEETVKYNGVDRVNNLEGYHIDNCVSCCTICNQAKHRLDVNYFLNWVERVYTFQQEKNK